MKILTLPLKAEYFDAIRDGRKEFEFRRVTPYWIKRLAGFDKVYDRILLTKGYPRRDDRARRLLLKWTGGAAGCIMVNHPHFGPNDVLVFAINVTGARLPIGKDGGK